MFRSLTVAVLVSLTALVGCVQGEGQRCQTNADCDDGLTCNRSLGVCKSSSAQVDDIDAGIDAPNDARIDAEPEVDAADPVDAATPDA